MHKTIPEALALVRALKVKLGERPRNAPRVRVGVAPTATALREVARALAGTEILAGGQNCHWEEKGAFTGEVSAAMLRDAGAKFVILGHSERRRCFHETDGEVAKKAKAAHAAGLEPIVCVGETLEEREAGKTEEVVGRQVRASLSSLAADEVKKTTLAYEPVWAIGTGRNASPEDAAAVHAHIRRVLDETFGAGTGEAVVIQYGGSVNPANAKALLSEDEIDGALVGGASLQADDFAAIVAAASAR